MPAGTVTTLPVEAVDPTSVMVAEVVAALVLLRPAHRDKQPAKMKATNLPIERKRTPPLKTNRNRRKRR